MSADGSMNKEVVVYIYICVYIYKIYYYNIIIIILIEGSKKYKLTDIGRKIVKSTNLQI